MEIFGLVSNSKKNKRNIFFVPNINLPISSKNTCMSPLLPRILLFVCSVNLAQLAVIWTHNRDVRGVYYYS